MGLLVADALVETAVRAGVQRVYGVIGRPRTPQAFVMHTLAAQRCSREAFRVGALCPAGAVSPHAGGIHPDEVRRYPLDPRL